MGRTIGEALSYEASKPFWSFKADEPSLNPPDGCAMTRDEWHSLSPGYRREIERQFIPKEPPPQAIDTVQAAKDHKAAVEYEGKKRL